MRWVAAECSSTYAHYLIVFRTVLMMVVPRPEYSVQQVLRG